jgi:hypothetical protein
MAIDGISLNEGATYTPAGGSSITFDANGESVANGVVCQNSAETDYFAREKLYATSRMPSLGTDGEFTKQKASLRIVRPSTLTSGKVVYNLIRIETEVHPEDGATEVSNLRSLGMAALNSSDLDDFFEAGSIR